jgi:putative intracellular protease/amidase
MKTKLLLLISIFILLNLQSLIAQKILLFVSHEETYYSEYIVALKAFQAAGYEVDVRSSSNMSATTYMIPVGTTIEETANSLTGSSFSDFSSQFNSNFGGNWDVNFNSVPGEIETNGSIHDIQNADEYEAFVIAGGTGILAYRVDGAYESQGQGNRLLSAEIIQSTAEKLNALALDALSKGKVVLAQCHGASLPVYWRIPNTNGSGVESLGISLLKNQFAAGYPQAETEEDYSNLIVNYLESSRVQVSSPNAQFLGFENAKSRLITSRDWYPQTVSYACRTVLNILETYPKENEINQELSVLVLHGGAIDPDNCHYTNRANDIPCNYGAGENLPADFFDVLAVLNANSANDNYNFVPTELNLTGNNLPFNPNDESSVLTFLSKFDGIIFYKHWSTGITEQIQRAIIDYVDNGGGIVSLHHGLYNDIDGNLNKDILINDLFGVSSEMNTWSANLTNFQMFNTNYGHFVNTFQINYLDAQEPPLEWSSTNLLTGSNESFSTYHRFSIFDEIYNNMSFTNNQTFGREVNQVLPLFSNDLNPSSQMHTSGFVKNFNQNLDENIGKLAYFIVGERKESLSMNHTFGQVLRNAVFWVSKDTKSPIIGINEIRNVKNTKIYPNPFSDNFQLNSEIIWDNYKVFNLLGEFIEEGLVNNQKKFNFETLKGGTYIIQLINDNETICLKFIKNKF